MFAMGLPGHMYPAINSVMMFRKLTWTSATVFPRALSCLHPLVGRSFQQSFGNDEQSAHTETDHDEAPHRQLRIPIPNGKDAQAEDDGCQDQIPPR